MLVVCVGVGIVAAPRDHRVGIATASSTPSASPRPRPSRSIATAKAKGAAGNYAWSNYDSHGRITFPSVYAPGCVPGRGSNSGATYPGVRAQHHQGRLHLQRHHHVEVSGLLDANAKVTDAGQAYAGGCPTHFQTSSRQVRSVPWSLGISIF